MNIGIEIIDGEQCLDLSRPDLNAHGVGGTQYEFVLLQYYLSLNASYRVFVYHTSENKYAEQVIDRKLSSFSELMEAVERDKIDILIVKQRGNAEDYDIYKKTKASVIVWAHNNIKYDSCKRICENSQIKRVVFVSNEQYDGYIDDDIIKKSCYIYNMYVRPDNEVKRKAKGHTVTFMGALVPWKGFHLLADVWKDIIAVVPDAKLNVLGSNYHNQEVDQQYYERYMSGLVDDVGELLPSVTFWGNVSDEKQEIFESTCVGVVNPSGLSETFCISAVEFEAYGVPVCSKKGYALLETVEHGKTGLLSENSTQLKNNIIKLLTEGDLNEQMSKNGMHFYKKFLPENIMSQWCDLFEEISHNQSSEVKFPKRNWKDNYKWFRMILYFLRFKLKMRKIPSYKKIRYMISK